MNRKLLVALMSGALVLPMAAQGVDIEASGHINRALVFHDMADDAVDPVHTDAGSSPSRFRFTGTSDMDNGVTAGVNLEYGAGGNAGDNPGIRHAAVSLGGEFGTLTVGQSAPATHLIGHASYDNLAWLSGTELGCDFCLAGGATFGGAAYAYGASRRPMVKFDTPSLGVANVSVSADGNDFWDAALRASGEAGALGYTFHVGFTNYAESTADATSESNQTFLSEDLLLVLQKEGVVPNDTLVTQVTGANIATHLGADSKVIVIDREGMALGPADTLAAATYYTKHTPMAAGVVTPETEVTTVAAAVSFGQGSHLNVAWLSADPDGGNSAEMSHFGIGHNIGDTSVAATFTNSDFGGGGESWGVGIGHALGEVQVYAGYKALEFDTLGAEDFGMFIVGSRIMFN
jgi:predicted porin